MAEAIERLIIVALLAAFILWLANDIRRDLKFRVIPGRANPFLASGALPSIQRDQNPISFWVMLGFKIAGVFVAATGALIIVYVFSTR
jgi:hypothetical protein